MYSDNYAQYALAIIAFNKRITKYLIHNMDIKHTLQCLEIVI